VFAEVARPNEESVSEFLDAMGLVRPGRLDDLPFTQAGGRE
jgi:hypothetical protein